MYLGEKQPTVPTKLKKDSITESFLSVSWNLSEQQAWNFPVSFVKYYYFEY